MIGHKYPGRDLTPGEMEAFEKCVACKGGTTSDPRHLGRHTCPNVCASLYHAQKRRDALIESQRIGLAPAENVC